MGTEYLEILSFKIPMVSFVLVIAVCSLAVGLAMGILTGRSGQNKKARESADKDSITANAAFMQGLNYILSDRTDEAIEQFTRVVAEDTQTVETYMALGNLYRSKGELERAITIRQGILVRPGLDKKTRLRALYGLGLDFRMAGLFERAIQTFQDVIKNDPEHIEAHRELIQIYEETRDWDQAYKVLDSMPRSDKKGNRHILAHYKVETGKVFYDQGKRGQAKAVFQKAITLDPGCVDAYLHLGDLYIFEKNIKKALAIWGKLADFSPEMSFLIYGRLVKMFDYINDLTPIKLFLEEAVEKNPDPLAHLALARILADDGDSDGAVVELNRALKKDPEVLEAHRELGLILLSRGRKEESLEAFQNLLENLEPPGADYQCQNCGHISQNLTWRCPRCQQWDTVRLHRRKPVLLSLYSADQESKIN